MSEPMVKFYMAELLLGVEELHMKKILYRDLKPGEPGREGIKQSGMGSRNGVQRNPERQNRGAVMSFGF